MTLSSMTGFARTDGASDGFTWQWELRSVNGRGLDIKIRVPQGYETMEWPAREVVAKAIRRGTVSAGLTVQRSTGAAEVRLNEAVLAEVIEAARRVRELTGSDAPRAEGLLGLRGVLEVVETPADEAGEKERATLMLAGLDQALGLLVAARAAEGARLADVLRLQLDAMERLILAIEADPERSPGAVKSRLAAQVAKLLEAGETLDPARLHQEAVLLATRADVAEEIARLEAHIAAARELMQDSGPSGRKLDFLAQELNREANTLCAKSAASAITHRGLELKHVVDQWREQAQNIE